MTRVVAGLALAALLAAPHVLPGLQSLLTAALANGIVALGVLVLLRAGQVTLGHGMFVATSAYTVAFLARAQGPGEFVVWLLAAVAVTGTGALLLGLFLARYRYVFFAMLTLAFSMVLYSLLLKLYRLTGGSDGLGIPTPSYFGITVTRLQFELILYYTTIAAALAAMALVRRYLDSPPGQALDAVRTNELRLEYVGLSAHRVMLAGFLVSALLAAVGGTLLALSLGHVAPEMSFWTRSAELLFITILGGIGSVANPFAGALLYELVRTYAAALVVEGWQLVLGLVLVLIILYAPGGLGEIFGRLLRALTRPAAEAPRR
jgi:ABC-type branched-subunit amino acid transport system permease subunit